MKKVIIFMLASAILFSCNYKQREIEKRDYMNKIRTAEQEFKEDLKNEQVNFQKGKKLTDLYVTYINKFPKDTAIPGLLYKTASLKLKYFGEVNEALNYYEILKKKYPKYEQTPMAVYTLGYIYNDRTKNFDKAKENYQYLIDHYPNHYLVEESKILLETVGKSDEELWKYIQNKEKISK
jgi:tetratricopeptide (TPR) repeat protein